jgi:hypothetical protein
VFDSTRVMRETEAAYLRGGSARGLGVDTRFATTMPNPDTD